MLVLRHTNVNYKYVYIIAIIYVLINTSLLFFAPSGVHLSQGADAASWYNPALSLLQHARFVTLDDPTVLQTYRTPLYPMYEALMLWIGGGDILAIIIGQIILLWLTGMVALKMVEEVLPRRGILALALVVFNPNALGSAHLVQSDVLYMFMVTITLCCLLLYKHKSNFYFSIVIGLLFGLTCLVRPSGQYLIPMLPLIYMLIGLTSENNLSIRRHFYNGILSTIAALFVVFSWAQHNESAGWGYNLATSAIEEVYFRDNVSYLESVSSDISLNEASNKIKNNEKNYIESYHNSWPSMTKQEQFSILTSYYKKQLITYDSDTIIKGFVESWIGFFGAGGAANIYNILGIDGPRSTQIMANFENHMSRVEAVLLTLLESKPIVVLISVFAFLYVIVLRILGIIGIISMIRNKDYDVLFILTGVVSYFMLVALFVGNSRYRLPIDPALIMMSLYGLTSIKNRNLDACTSATKK